MRDTQNKIKFFTDHDGHAFVDVGDSIAYRYEVLQLIGKGTSSKVYKAKDHKDGEIVALKIIKAVPKYIKCAQMEIEIL